MGNVVSVRCRPSPSRPRRLWGRKREGNVTLRTDGRLNFPSRSALKQNFLATPISAALIFTVIRSMHFFIVYRLELPLPVARGASLQEEREREREGNGALTLLWRGDGDGLRRELLVEIPGVRFRRDLWHERWYQLDKRRDGDREELIKHYHVQIKMCFNKNTLWG